MEATSLFIQIVDVVLSDTMSHMIMGEVRKVPWVKGRGKDIN